ncbi:serine/threonine-protein kinase ripk4, putative [Talaromyces stipitatus ATCC 10500]|uniref:Serine/threonine-protein kinase ripk4, putative n=1 Tax=Talaromyces stipitatus (strain ATCC 10500 / CBS 375.48 / QM 6759 / NRRL 1006) TaxID=441959 RepID=B8MJI0_TALSN|nr:serine/threonine-protein kinase ripk4, putative [Talaromyces stipitatus ATCC 10500]EED15180.1 serine/threonine-protein kinase ripk4, putative [Talaromyces stipitatus ATCC 10500]
MVQIHISWTPEEYQPPQKPSWSAKMDDLMTETSVTDDLCFTPLHHVVIGLEKADVYQQLRLNNNCINIPDSLGRSPLHWAVIQGNTSIIAALLEHGAFPGSRDKEQMTPLHEVCRAPQSSQAACARLLIDSGADVDARDSWGRTALRIAVGFTNTSPDLIEILLEEGADVNDSDIYGQTPLLKSIRAQSCIMELLLKHGASTEATDIYGNTPLSEAIYRNSAEQLNLLMKYGSKTNQLLDLQPGRRAREGRINILHFTAWYGGIEVMRALESSEQYLCRSPDPIDDFVQYKEVRLAHGLGVGKEEYEAFVHLLSTVKYSCEGGDEDEKDDPEGSVGSSCF